MRLPSLPGPRDVLDLVERSGVQLAGLLPRVTALLSSAERLVADAGALVGDARGLLDRIEGTRVEADAVSRRAEATLTKTEALVDAAAPVTTRSAELIDAVEAVTTRAAGLVDSTELVTARVTALLDSMAPSLVRLQPTLERLAETTDPQEVDALVTLLDQLPLLAEKLQTDIIPILDTLGSVAPDLHDLLDVSKELNEMLGKLPGMGRIKRRVEDQQEIEGRD